MYIEKRENGRPGLPEIIIYKDNVTFQIIPGGNCDLYWLIKNGNFDDEINIEITKDDNEYLYNEMATLYKTISMGKLLGRSFKKESAYKELFKDGVINWISDDRDCKNVGNVSIAKKTNAYDVTLRIERFKSGIGGNDYGSIRFRSSGSAYDMFFIPFTDMYRNLCAVEELNQITIKQYCKRRKINIYSTK